METKRLVLKGDISAAKAFRRYIPLSLFLGIGGLVLAAFLLPSAEFSYAGTRWAFERTYVPFFGGMLGTVFIVLGVATPFLAVMEAKKMFIDVYEDRVCGAYKQLEGRAVKYIPYDLTFDRIESVSAKKAQVYLQISGRTIESQAFNADEIAAAIAARLPRYGCS